MTFQTVEQLQATVAEQAQEIKRLTGCLAKANANHEHFEREWYLSGHRIEEQAHEIERLREVIVRLLAWCENEAGNGCNLSDEQVADELESVEFARAALQPKEGEG